MAKNMQTQSPDDELSKLRSDLTDAQAGRARSDDLLMDLQSQFGAMLSERRDAKNRADGLEADLHLAEANYEASRLLAVGFKRTLDDAKARLQEREEAYSTLNHSLDLRQQEVVSHRHHASTRALELSALSRLAGRVLVGPPRDLERLVLVRGTPAVAARTQLVQSCGRGKPGSRWIFAARARKLMRLRRALIETSGLFDGAWYLATYPDVAAAGVEAIDHYNENGSLELRDPGPMFSCRDYIDTYTDVRAANVEPFLHYLVYGRAEGRIASLSDDPENPSILPLGRAASTLSLGESQWFKVVESVYMSALGREPDDHEFQDSLRIVSKRGLSACLDGIFNSDEAFVKAKREADARATADARLIGLVSDETLQDARVDELLAETSQGPISIRIPPTLMRRIPSAKIEKISRSKMIRLECSDELPLSAAYSIVVSDGNDRLGPAHTHAIDVVLLDERRLDDGALLRPSFRVGRDVTLNAERRHLARQIPEGWDVSPVFYLHRAPCSARLAEAPAVVLTNVRDEVVADRDFASWTAAQLVLSHYVKQSAAEALFCLDVFDRRFGSDCASRYGAIVGAHV